MKGRTGERTEMPSSRSKRLREDAQGDIERVSLEAGLGRRGQIIQGTEKINGKRGNTQQHSYRVDQTRSGGSKYHATWGSPASQKKEGPTIWLQSANHRAKKTNIWGTSSKLSGKKEISGKGVPAQQTKKKDSP